MSTVNQFIRRIPAALLREYFAAIGLELPEGFRWTGQPPAIAKRVIDAIAERRDVAIDRLIAVAERIGAMTDELGEASLRATSRTRNHLDGLPGPYARALWTFLHDEAAFRRAEDARFADERRRGRQWNAYVCVPGLAVARDDSSRLAMEQAVAAEFETGKVQIDICDRTRPSKGDAACALVQATIWLEDRPNDIPVFQGERIVYASQRPVREAAVTYEPISGVIDVVAQDRQRRERLAQLFAENLLAQKSQGNRLPLRQFVLNRMRSQHDFPTDAEDNITEVAIRGMRLMPFDMPSEQITLEILANARRSIWDLARQRLRQCDGRIEGYDITRLKLVIRFGPRGGAGRPRSLPITITPFGTNLKDCTATERMVGDKYLPRWGLIRDV